MKKKTNFIKKIIFSAILVLAIICSSGVGLFSTLYNTYSVVYAYEDTSQAFDNNDFTNYTSNSNKQPYTANKWTISGGDAVSKGVIKVDEESFEKNNYGLSSNPSRAESISGDDYSIFMFHSSKNYGQAEAKSNSLTLSNGSFYEISILVKTMDNALGSITATFGDQNVDFTNISTESNKESYWRTYSFYVSTDTEDVKATLTLRFGSSSSPEGKTMGAVFFDNISVKAIDSASFASKNEGIYVKKTNIKREALTGISNGDFENGLEGWTSESVTSGTLNALSTEVINSEINTNFNNTTSNIALTNVAGNAKSLLLLNTDAETKKITTTIENTFNIKQFGLYKITLLYKTGDLSGTGLNIKIYDNGESDPEDSTTYSKEQTNLTSSTTLANYNDFSLATFYVKGDPKQDRKVLMEISLGEGKGWAIVDEIKLYPIVTSEYSSTNALDYTSGISTDSNIGNNTFDFATINNLTESDGGAYPVTPTSWTYVGSDNAGKSGIIRLNQTLFNSDHASYGSPANPGYDKAYYSELVGSSDNMNENVLMVRNNSDKEVYYKSSSVTLSANSTSSTKYAKISVSVKAVEGTAFIRLADSDGNILAQIENISTENETSSNYWKRYNFYVYNSVSEKSVELQLGSYAGSNFVYFDNIATDTSITEEPTDIDGTTKILVNLSTNSFANKSGFSGYSSESGSYKFSYVNNVETRKDAKDSTVLMINNIQSTYQNFISDYTYSLTADKYYEFSVWIKTNFASENNSGDYGATFELLTLDSDQKVIEDEENLNKFVNIQTTKNEDNGWVKYSIYILAKSSQNVKIRLGVGTESTLTSGEAYFDDVTVVEIEEEDYPTTANDTTLISTVVEPKTDKEEDSTNDSDESTESADINIWLLVSSILLVISLILAIIGYSIRRIPKKKKETKVDKKKYDKKKDEVDKDKITKDLKTQREENLAKLNSEIEELEEQYNALKQEYEEKTKDSETLDQKVYASYTRKTNKLVEKIDYLKSAVAYLNDQANVKMMEKKEIKKNQKELEKKNEELNLTTSVEDVQEKTEEPKKKTKKKLQKFN